MKRYLSLPGSRKLELGERPVVMGIINVTPDSFFGASRAPEPLQAAERALALVEEGADILDFGAESTRPGSAPIDPDEEKRRLIPALREFRKRSGAIVSVDTRRADVARAALAEGADIINDIGAFGDPDMAQVAARAGAVVVLMHMRGDPATMQENPEYRDCAAEVRDFLLEAAQAALDAGISPSAIVLDPGIGFGKRLEHNLDLLRRLSLLTESGYPVLVGLSRKRFVGDLTGRQVEDRLAGSLGAACAAWMRGADIFRVHDVAATVDALRVFDAAGAPDLMRHIDMRRANGL
jgi:dihydropteroate synthase